jgi:hypothetical protein
VWEWLWEGENLLWVILGGFGIWFAFTELPKLIYSIASTKDYDEEDNDPAGNDNVGPRKPYDYL